ncbi:hypothetical protein ACVWW6_006041 [Bradyrhizobium sp. USDA 3311]
MANPLYTVEPDRYMSAGNAHWPARYATAITPSDVANVAIGPAGCYAKKLYIGVAGDVTVITAGDNSNNGLGTPVLFKAVPVGILDVQVRAVMATGTAATNIVGLAD